MTGLVACINSIQEYIDYQTFAKANQVLESEIRFIWTNCDLPCAIEGVYIYIKSATIDKSSIESISETMSAESIFFILSQTNFYLKKKCDISSPSRIWAHTFTRLQVSKTKAFESLVPRLSAMISLYNCEKYIDNLFREIHKQSIKDETEWLIGFYPTSFPLEEESIRNKINTFRHEISHVKVFEFHNKDMNLYSLWNFLLTQASSSYITSFHPDDIRTKTWGEMCVSYLDKHDDVGLVTPVYYPCKEDSLHPSSKLEKPWFLRRFEFYRQSNGEEERETITSSVFEECEEENEFSSKDLFDIDKNLQIIPYDIPNASPIWRKSLHEKHHLFDETDNIPADLIMWLFFGSKMKMVQLLKCHVWFRISDQQLHRKHFFAKDTWEFLISKFASSDMIDYVKYVDKNRCRGK
jgi:glycosyltransferase involved in cell wall biosynthesis